MTVALGRLKSLRRSLVQAQSVFQTADPFPGDIPNMSVATPTLTHRLRPLLAALCLGAASAMISAPPLARGPDGIAYVAWNAIDAGVNISTTQTGEAKAGGGEGGQSPQWP